MKRTKEDWIELIGCCVFVALCAAPWLYGFYWAAFVFQPVY